MLSRVDTRLRLGAAGLLVLAVVLTFYRIVFSPDGRVIVQDPRAPWIMADMPVTGLVQQWGRSEAPVTLFANRFFVGSKPRSAQLTIRTFGDFSLFINGTQADSQIERPGNWKTPTVLDVGAHLVKGENWVVVEVRNKRGPALLSFRLEGSGVRLVSGPGWVWEIDNSAPSSTIIADDVRPLPEATSGERTLDALASKGGILALLFVISGTAFLILRRRLDLKRFPRLPWLCFGGVAAAWLVLFVSKFLSIDLLTGFDAIHHIDYVKFLRSAREVPLATRGGAMYHPPFFYLLSALLEQLASWLHLSAHEAVFAKLLPFLAGLGNVGVALALCRRLFPGDVPAALVGLAFAAFLPMNLYMAAYFSNESLHAFLSGCSLLILVDLFQDKQVGIRKTALLSVLIGLALLTKLTAALIALMAVIGVSAKILMVHRQSPRAVMTRLAALALPALILAGWYYARNFLEFGQPVIVNWGELPGAASETWWSHPGFHTLRYYLTFGFALCQPYFSAFHSLWDGLYSSLWGDGFLGGTTLLSQRHPHWNYDYMTAAYPLAAPATLLLLAGWVRAGWIALRDPDGARRAAFGTLVLFCAALLFATFYLTLGFPFYGQAKASYGLAALPALCIFFVQGFLWLDQWLVERGWLLPRAALFGWFGTFIAVCYLSFQA